MGALGSEKFQLPVTRYCSFGFRVDDTGIVALVILSLTGEIHRRSVHNFWVA